MHNQWVVPYNRGLLVKYQCLLKIEICCHARSLKYTFKCCLKGHDRATVLVNRRKKRRKYDPNNENVDVINSFFDGRYLCSYELTYRIFGFPIHRRSISVKRQPFHLPNQKNFTFCANKSLEKTPLVRNTD